MAGWRPGAARPATQAVGSCRQPSIVPAARGPARHVVIIAYPGVHGRDHELLQRHQYRDLGIGDHCDAVIERLALLRIELDRGLVGKPVVLLVLPAELVAPRRPWRDARVRHDRPPAGRIAPPAPAPATNPKTPPP